MDHKFDIVIVDSVDRVSCIKVSIEMLKDSGVIILDNSEVKEYSEGILFLLNSGFRKIDFVGIFPGCNGSWPNKINTTTLFYRDNNCFNI